MDLEEEDQRSRSQVKRDFREIKEMVKQLIELPPHHLRRMPLSQRNIDEVVAARDLTRSALQRQLRYLVRRIEQTDDVAAIRSALDGPIPDASDSPDDSVHDDSEPPKAELHELWAEELIAGDDQVLGVFIEDHPEVEHRKLRRLVRSARKEKQRSEVKATTAVTKLVAFLQNLRADDTNEGR